MAKKLTDKQQKTAKQSSGKNLSSYMNGGFHMKSSRRFSIAHSSSSSEDDDDDEEQPATGYGTKKINYGSQSQSDSSLTAVSDTELSDKSSVLFEENIIGKGPQGKGKGTKGKGKSLGKGKATGKATGKGKSLKNYGKKYTAQLESDEEAISFVSSEDSAISDSSSDDENIDFVKLQAQKKVKASAPIKQQKPRTGSVSKPKYGRRRSESALPEDINFELEFDDNDNAIEDSSSDDDDDDNDNDNDNAIDDNDEESFEIVSEDDPQEEDLGEVIDDLELPQDNKLEADLDFNIHVPKFNEEDINSDNDYEIDDNELLATLQADNDLEEFNTSINKRNNSITSMDDEEQEFLKQEEKFLVNEFENNGFDEEEIANVPSAAYESDLEPFDDDDDEEEDDYHDMVDFTLDLNENEFNSGKMVSKIKRKGYDSDDDDDSYLWNYFFSSDNDSESDSEHHRSARYIKKPTDDHLPIGNANEDDENYDSGESTDVDSNVPTSNNALGSQKAKEVLSSKTADYRPPILGTWVAMESQPFSIIDGLSTRSLNPNTYRHSINPKSKRRKSFVGTPYSDDSALGLDELLNISEMDYDDTDDVKIWRDFNNQKKRVPLGAFRNKSYLQNSFGHDLISSNLHQYNPSSKANNEYQRKYLAKKKSKKNLPIPPKSKRRRASRTEAFNEGYRPTKSGLFSEQALNDVEEMLSDDNDIMALIKGL